MEILDLLKVAAPVLTAAAGTLKALQGLKKRRVEKRRQNTRDNETHTFVSNHLIHAVERIELKLDHVSTRVDDHIEAHKERGQ